MEVHNTAEDMVITRVNEVFEALDKERNAGKFCTCDQCKLDIICYTLNRLAPHYIVSNRGATRVYEESIERQQQIADITALIHDGLQRVSHNQRPNFSHSPGKSESSTDPNLPVFNFPTIRGRLFHGNNFAPISDVDVELLRDGELVAMKDGNWQNPYRIVPNTEGSFTFWPAAVSAPKVNEPRVFEFVLRVSVPDYELLDHYFKISVTSVVQAAGPFTLNRTYKLPDLYMFPPGEAEQNG